MGVIVAAVGIVSVSADRVLFFIPAAELQPARDLFGSLQERVFMGFALLLGICMGPMQAASRTMIGRLAPRGHDRRVLRPVRPLRPGDGVDGAARHRHRHRGDRSRTGWA